MELITISADTVDEAIEVLALAFQNYPLIRYYFPDSGANDYGLLRSLYRLCYEWKQAYQWSFTGVIHNHQIVAVACFTEPEAEPEPILVSQADEAFLKSFGETVTSRIEKYVQTKAAYLLKEPHFYLDMLGVHPNAQGKGFGKVLLEWLHSRSLAHPTSVGVALDTETPINVAIYERCGYSVTAKTQLDNIPIWCMFRES